MLRYSLAANSISQMIVFITMVKVISSSKDVILSVHVKRILINPIT